MATTRHATSQSLAARVVPGHPVPQHGSADDLLAIGRALIQQARQTYGLPPNRHTVAVGWTGIDGLASQRFVGASRELRALAALPNPVPHIEAPRANAQFLDHAEQDVANGFIDALSALRPQPPLDGEYLRIFISHARGPCSACAQGLTDDPHVAPGVLSQLSERYPGMTLTLAWENDSGRLGTLFVEGGRRLWNRQS